MRSSWLLAHVNIFSSASLAAHYIHNLGETEGFNVPALWQKYMAWVNDAKQRFTLGNATVSQDKKIPLVSTSFQS